MSDDDGARRELPARPSKEHLRKQAKRLARRRSLGLAEAQRALAREHGSASWADLMRRVEEARSGSTPALSPLAAAARAGDAAAVRALLTAGHPVDGAPGEGGTPLRRACASDAPAADRIAVAEALLAAGASTRRDDGGATPLHAAAARGPLDLVELLIRRGALEWQPDRRGRSPLDAARRGRAPDRAAIVELLDRPVIRDPSFRVAVAAIHAGDAAGLAALLDAEPRLVRERIVEPDCYREAARHQYFRDPKLFWFIANNPILAPVMPANMAEVAQVMIARGADGADVTYALELVMTGSSAREHGLQIALLELLLAAGAAPSARAILMTLGHRELAPIQALLDAGYPLTAPIAAGLGRADRLAELLRGAPPAALQDALSVAVVNRRVDAARVALDAGADPSAFMTVHAHSTPLHQAALFDDTELLDLLIARGARADIRDTMWNGTPLGWAIHEGKATTRARLEELEPR
ncbi:MAG TPA: ankyrin repeat domain-containing protein [Kofleriaceae bacterium]|nr:ankyrin repeat domain-containing protein [Kofleriaceae bacterium]